MFIGQQILSPYGAGTISSVRYNNNNVIETVIVSPINWTLDRNQKPQYYLNPKDVKPKFKVNDEVSTSFGIGFIVSIREEDGIFVVQLKKWKLATNKSPTLYLNQASVSDPPPIVETFIDRSINKSKTFKQIANDYFKENNFVKAKDNYSEALMSIQHVGDNLTDYDKARVYEQLILCQNNAAVCCLKIKSYLECEKFALNSYSMITFLEKSFTSSLKYSFIDIGITQEDLFIKWKRKSLYLLGKSQLLLQKYTEAIESLTLAQKIVSSGLIGDAEYKSLIDQAIRLRQIELKKEKSTWQKAFQKNEIEEDNPSEISFNSKNENSLDGSMKMPNIDKIIGKIPLNKPIDKKSKVNPSPLPILGVALVTVAAIFGIYYFRAKK